MAYTRIDYLDLGTFQTDRITSGIKKIYWDKRVSVNEIESFIPHFCDERTKVLIQTTTCMPFSVYLIPASDARRWSDYLMNQKSLNQVYNCVYLLFGHDFIYAGKSVNGDRILGHIDDPDKDGFEYQMLFVPNNENAATMTNWTSDFMSYLESLMIERLDPENNSCCKNLISGKSQQKNQRDLNLNEDKEAFAANVVELLFEAFCDITYCSYLVPKEECAENCLEDDNASDTANDEGMLPFWRSIIGLSDSDSKFHELVKPQRSYCVYRNMNTDKLIANASLNCVVKQSTCRVELIGDRNSAEINLEIFDQLMLHKDEIEKEFGCQLKWDRKEGKFTTSISLSKSLRYNDASNGSMRDIADFFSEYFDKFYTIMPKFCSKKEMEEDVYDIDR